MVAVPNRGILDITTYEYTPRCLTPQGDPLKIIDMDGTVDGKYWATVYEDHTVKIWDKDRFALR
jgi:hypothetical protein